MTRFFLMLAALFGAVLPAAAQGGSTGLTFLTLGVGSRGLAMGEAYAAASNDPAAMQYNPATLSSIDVTTITLMHRAWIQGTKAEFLAGAFNFGAVSLGLSVYSVNSGDIEVRNVPGPAISTFTARDASLGMTVGYAATSDLSFGATVKYLYEKILVDNASGTAFDFGGVYRTPFGVRIGAAVTNLGSMSDLGTEPSALPKLFRGGLSYGVDLSNAPVSLTGALDVLAPLGDGTSHMHFGGEAVFYQAISVRTGYQTGYDARAFTAGAGVTEGIVTVDYAFMPTRYDLGSTHAITLTIQLR